MTETATTTDTTPNATTATDRTEESYWPEGLLDRVRATRGAERVDLLLDLLVGLPRYVNQRAEAEALAYANAIGARAEAVVRDLVDQLNASFGALQARVAELEGRPLPEAPTLDLSVLDGLAARMAREVRDAAREEMRDLATRPRIKVIERNALGDMTAVVETVLPEDAA